MVEIPEEKAKMWASAIRTRAAIDYHDLADLLDPKPPTLREQVAKEIATIVRAAMPLLTHDAPEWDAEQADAVLAVVADWLAAQPLSAADWAAPEHQTQRDHDVRLLRGG